MTAHQDVAGVVAECLRPDGIMPVNSETTRQLTQAVISLSKALSEAEAERDYQTGFVQELQTALAFWIPGVDLRLDEATRELAADDAYLLAGSTGERDLPCWGDEILERALTAESRISDLERQLAEETERCAGYLDKLADTHRAKAKRATSPSTKAAFDKAVFLRQLASTIRGGAK